VPRWAPPRPGRVAFAGSVAGMRWVSVAHPDGHLTSYGPLADLRVRAGQHLERGAVLGALAAGGHGAGARDHGLHWGARDAQGRYLDPLTLIDEDLRRASLVGVAGWEGSDHRVRPYDRWEGGRAGGLLVAASPTAGRPGFAVPPTRTTSS
jgi:murein DD-endopeptidase MepM/ murein hydrolase activator NlpD